MSSSPPSSDSPFEADELEKRLDESLDPVLSSRRTAQPLAARFAALTREQQDFGLKWVGIIARTSGELAYQFASVAPDVLPSIDAATAEAWIIHAMDAFDRDGLYRASAELKNVDAFMRASQQRGAAVEFEDANRVLALFLCGLSGRPLRLEADADAYTDTETIHLPARIAEGRNRRENFLRYKALATHLWAQTRYGTFNVDPLIKLSAYADSARATALFNYFETLRLDAILSRELPGLAREMGALHEGASPPQGTDRLLQPDATAVDSLALVEKLYDRFAPPQLSYMGTMRPDLANAVRAARLQREKKDLQNALSKLRGEQARESGQPGSDEGAPAYSIAGGPRADFELMLDGMAVDSPAHVKDLLNSIAQDLGEIPEDYLDISQAGAAANDHHAEGDMISRGSDDEHSILYNEWDYKRRHYRKNWCMLRENEVQAGDAKYVDATLVRYRAQVLQLRRTFEMLRGDDKRLKKQPSGDDIDLDAVITAYADVRSGRELPEQLFERRLRVERDIAVMFMVDMSGSTKGWINDAERESLVMLCEALEVLGDRYAIYGFSGITRKRCEIYRIKRFDEPYDQAVKQRIAGIGPQDYTRMGVAIRHLTALLNAVDARTKLLITLSDGKPDDYSDNYRGEYGIEDTRQALIEAQRRGIHSFCITIDREAREYLPHMYGAVNYTVIEDAARLPLKVADVYRRITT